MREPAALPAEALATPTASPSASLRPRDCANGYFYTPPPLLVPAEPRTVEALGDLSVAGELPGGVLLEGETTATSAVQVALRLVGPPAMLRCTLRLKGAPSPPPLAKRLPPAKARTALHPGKAELAAGDLRIVAHLSPFKLLVACGDLVLEEDRSTADPNDTLVVLPLGLTRLAGGPSEAAFHETFFAEPDERFWGLGEKFTALDKRGQLISCWNQDALGCADERSYKNVPFFISSRGYAVFVDTTGYAEFDMCHSVQGSWSVVVADTALDFYIIFGGPEECLGQYQCLVGGPVVPPAWSFGTWVSTGFSADSAEGVRRCLGDLQQHRVPCDVLHVDTYWQRFGNWSDLAWDTDAFPDPAGLLADVHAAGLKASLWINPYIGQQSPLFETGQRKGYFLCNSDGTAWVGDLWGDYHPPVAIVDLTNPEAVSWWTGLLASRLAEGADVFKTDFGEAIPAEVVAYDGTPGALLHNRYPLLYNDAVMGLLKSNRQGRPVVWARSTWAGGQRHPIQWSGDSSSTWQDLAATLRAGNSMALSGHHFWSHDIGGFHGKPSPELFVRWAQFGLLSPFSRFHGASSRLPWDFGTEALAAVRHAATLRTRLFPYLYALAWRSALVGTPIMRPMVLDHPASADAQAADLQYLLGPDLLVAPCYRPGGRRPVWFPPGRWAHYATGQVVDGPNWEDVSVPLERAPLWLRAGSLIPAIHPRPHIGERPPACEEMVVVLADGASTLSVNGGRRPGRTPEHSWPEANSRTGDGAGGRPRSQKPGNDVATDLVAPLVAADGPEGEALAQVVVERTREGLALSGPSELANVKILFLGATRPSSVRFGSLELPARCSATLAEAWDD